MNSFALFAMPVISSVSRLNGGMLPFDLCGRVYETAFQRWPSPAPSRNSFQWVAFAL
jgi:hypothetical protein